MADEVAALMAERFGAPPRAARSGSALEAALFFHGRHLPARLHRHARRLAQADRQCRATGQPGKARASRLRRAHEALLHHLRHHRRAAAPGRRVRLAATALFGLMLLAAAILWLQVSRGQG